VGDRHYVPDEVNEPLIDRQALHAWKLEFLHPRTGRRMFFEATQPTDLRRLIEHYRKVDK
jgi:23S rRNA pseudouridine1911/1915/1917 synthase